MIRDGFAARSIFFKKYLKGCKIFPKTAFIRVRHKTERRAMDLEDSKIVDLYWRRSEEAIPETAAKFGGYCRTIAYNILSDEQDAEECVNDTWFKAWNSMPTHRPALLAPYLAKLTRWLSLSRLRERNALRRGGGETLFLPIGTDI